MAYYRHYNPYRKQQRVLLLLLLILMVSLLAWKSMEAHISTNTAERQKYSDILHGFDDVLNRSGNHYSIDNESLIGKYHILYRVGEAEEDVITSDLDKLVVEWNVEESDNDPGKITNDVDIFGADSHVTSASNTLSNVDIYPSNSDVNKTDIVSAFEQPYNNPHVNSSDVSQTENDFPEEDANVSQSDDLFQVNHVNKSQSDIDFDVNDTNLRGDVIGVNARDVNQSEAQVQVSYENVNQQQISEINKGDPDFQINDGYANEPDADFQVNKNGDVKKPSVGLYVDNDDVKRFDDDVLPLVNFMP